MFSPECRGKRIIQATYKLQFTRNYPAEIARAMSPGRSINRVDVERSGAQPGGDQPEPSRRRVSAEIDCHNCRYVS